MKKILTTILIVTILSLIYVLYLYGTDIKMNREDITNIDDTVKIQKVSALGCSDKCEFDIVVSMQNVSDQRIIEINNQLTSFVFVDENLNPIDIRFTENRVIPKTVNIETMGTNVVYADSDVIEYNERIVGDNNFTVLDNYDTYTLFINDKKSDFISEDHTQQILDYFYPEYGKIFDDLKKESVNSCIEDKKFPDDYKPTLIVSKKEVSYGIYFNRSSRACVGEFDTLNIPISELLKKFPQFVPKDSLLWKYGP